MTTRSAIPAEALNQHIAILGKTGSGKTYAAKGAVEGILTEGGRVCIIDPTGAWHGLRSSATGKSAGFPVVIFGGNHADLPLGAAHGEAIAEIIGTASTPAIIDTSMMRVGERTRFFADFADALVRKNNGPLHLIIDEAHLFAPQGKVSDPQSGAMLHAANNLVSLGRSRGLRIILITQRPAKLHKDSLTQVETLVALRLIAPQDRAAVEDWIKDNADQAKGREIIASLATLKTGSGWVWAPELGILDRVTFPKIRTFDSSRAPEDGAAGVGPVLAPIDKDAIAQRLDAVAKDALANDPARLKKEIADLTRKLATAPAAITQPDAKALEAARYSGYLQGTAAGRRHIRNYFNHDFINLVDLARAEIERLTELSESEAPPYQNGEQMLAALPTSTPRPSAPVQRTDSPLSGPEQKIVDAIRWWNVLGIPAPSHVQVGFIAGYSHKSGTWATYLSKLRTAGMIEGRGDLVLTAQGASVVNEPGAPPSGDDLRQTVIAKIDKPLQRILGPIIDNYPEGLSHAQASASAGYSAASGTWATYLSKLRSLDLIEGRGELKAQRWLFP